MDASAPQSEPVVVPNPSNVVVVQPQDPPIEATNNNENHQRGTGTLGKVYSKWWAHYHKVEGDGVPKAKCKYCSKKLVGDPKQGTTHLKNHYYRCSKRKATDIKQQVLQGNMGKDKFQLTPFSFDQDNSRKELAREIIKHEYPLTIVDHEGFRSFCQSLNPCFKMVSRNTIKKDCFILYELEKEATMKLFERSECRVAITTDMWTSSQNKGFMAITAHYIDESWRLQNRIIRFKYVPSPHTGEALCEELKQCLLDWNIDHKLSTITVDNCSTNDVMVNLLLQKLELESLLVDGTLINMRCCAHILNLIVKEGLKVIGPGIEKIRNSIRFWIGTPKRLEKFEETVCQLKNKLRITSGKKPTLDCETRWNSTYMMLNTALEYKEVFARLKIREPKYKCYPSEDDWILSKEICDRLKTFYNATTLLSGTEYPTVNLCFSVICEAKLALDRWSVCGIAAIEKMAFDMIEKFNKYWSNVHGLVGVAAVLDPRYKKEVLNCYYGEIYPENCEEEVEKILGICRILYQQYEKEEQD